MDVVVDDGGGSDIERKGGEGKEMEEDEEVGGKKGVKEGREIVLGGFVMGGKGVFVVLFEKGRGGK